MTAKLLRLLRRLRGLSTCPTCSGPTLKGKCPACIQAAVVRATNYMLEIHTRNQVLSNENRLLSRRLMVHEMKAAREHRTP